MTQAGSSYDEVAYPTAVFAQATPDRLATVARLHGLKPPPIDRARVLEIGGGDAMNLIALGAAYPHTTCLSFDLSAKAVERGREWLAAAGIGNVEVRELDILDAAAGAIEGEWDYVIAHGVYAWVPEPVRAAVMALIGRVLSPHGVAFVSYNSTPGSYLRLAMRELLLDHLKEVEGTGPRLAAAKSFLWAYSRQPATSDEPLAAALRQLAREMAERPDAVLHHDEMGDVYAPQSLSQVAAAAGAAGLRWLGDADVGRMEEGFGGPTEEAVLRAAQLGDYVGGRFFRQSLLVRSDARPERRLTGAAVAPLFASCQGSRGDNWAYALGSARFEVSDVPLREALDRLIARWPGRIACSELLKDEARLRALFGLFDGGLIGLHAGEAPLALTPGERPEASPLVRVQLALGWPAVSTLDHRTLTMPEPRARAFVALLDGSRDRRALERDWAAAGHAEDVPVEAALQATAAQGLLRG